MEKPKPKLTFWNKVLLIPFVFLLYKPIPKFGGVDDGTPYYWLNFISLIIGFLIILAIFNLVDIIGKYFNE